MALFAILLVPMLLASALAVDVGTWYARITVLQRAADAAALAGTIWMPDLAKATSVANESLLKNGINPDGSGGVNVVIAPGSSATSLRVTLTDTKATTYFSDVIGWKQRLSRSAEAEYYMPLPLGSPLNYFGGDASKNAVLTTTDPPGGVYNSNANKPNNSQQCRVSGNRGRWSNGSYNSSNSGTNGWALCEWALENTTQIDPNMSPGFWAMVAGPGTAVGRGDAFSSRCNGQVNCSSPSNLMYRPSGYWYVIKMPESGASQTTISIYDAAYYMGDGATVNAGDINLDGNSTVFTTEFRVYKQDSALDINVRSPLSASASNTDGSCYWQLTNQNQYKAQWKPLCTINNPEPGGTYLLNVRTTHASNQGSGLNGYAVKAISTGNPQPAVYAYGDMAMFNNITSGDATFYLAEVGPEYAGKVLLIDLFDSGDAEGTATLYPMMPSTSAPRPVRNVPASDCTYTASPNPNSPVTGSNPPGGATSPSVNTPHASDVAGSCGVTTVTNGNIRFNNEWVHLRIKVPSDYTCTKGLNPNTQAGSCWWGIKYNFSAAARDVTTWKASIEGNPVHLVQ